MDLHMFQVGCKPDLEGIEVLNLHFSRRGKRIQLGSNTWNSCPFFRFWSRCLISISRVNFSFRST